MITQNPAAGVLARVATTLAAGFALQNATPNILTWTAPNDGQTHAVIVNAFKIVTVAETGGNVTIAYTCGGQAKTVTVAPGGAAIGTYPENWAGFVCDPGTTVTLAQQTALTAGASVLFAELIAA